MAQLMSQDPKNSSRKDDDDRDDKPRKAGGVAGDDVGFFEIRKRGQGYWTRLCTALATAGLLVVVARFIYVQVNLRLADALFSSGRAREAADATARYISLGVAALLVLIGGIFAWKVMNGAKGADFLITTDSEMKKVNWASRKELFGSTRIVIIFLILIACFLFGADIAFGWFFNVIGVLKHGPFSS